MKLRPMNEAPKDREIFAVYLNRDAYGCPRPDSIDWGNFHPIRWDERPWDPNFKPRWGMRWNNEFRGTLANYGGWVDPKEFRAALSAADAEPDSVFPNGQHGEGDGSKSREQGEQS
jgi:hypothetical protein